ncbi:toxin TcdB middle/N-terminal domain-containing protein [Treponema sp. OMZ 838]|uniref:toxin TcdB middle/N-terminal domain-containing protein n=1 Tax=Treponema sp. OMZ 838 TaxID=1539298 RepID=UPI0009DEF817|nr:toxin TcdB middle/N-terminal domain-containing protein [Treponema sp. OMZ 838]
MKIKFCFYSQPNYSHPRTAIAAEILFAARVMQVWFLKRPSGKTPREQNSSDKKIGAESAVLHFVFFEVIVNKMQQSAKSITIRIARNTLPEVFPLTIGSGKTMPFEKRWSRYKETAENKAEAYRVYGEHLFSACDAVDARIFSKGDGDGLPDRVFNIGGADKLYVQRNKLGKVGLLKKIKLPTGGSYEIAYQRVGNTRELPQSKYVLSSVTMNSGLQTKSGNVQSYKTQYSYKDGYYDRKAKEFYGFKTVRAVTGTGKVTETEYYIDAYYRKGMVKKETVSHSGTVYSIKEYEVDEVPHARVKREWNTLREGYREIRTESEYRYDRYGNVTTLEDKGDVTNPNDDIIARIRYWDSGDERRYFKAHPEKIEVLDGKSGRLLRKREGRYDSQTGAITEVKQYTSSGTSLTYTIDWDESGNIKTLISPTGKKVSYRYQDGIYPVKITEEGSTGGAPYESTLLWDSALGVKLEETDSAGNTMKYRYDGFGRVTEVKSPYDTGNVPYAKYEYHTPSSSFWYTVTANKLTTEAADTAIMKTIVMHDGLGRALYTAKEGEVYREGTAGETNVGWNISGATYYDEAGRKIKEGMPFFYGGDLPNELANKAAYASVEQFYELNDFTKLRNETVYTYDGIDRVIKTVLPDGSEQKNEYAIENSLQVTTATDPLENKSVTKKDARGNIREVERLDKNGTRLTKGRYEYSVLGEMLRAYDANENIVSVTYDLLGRRVALESKDSGRKEWRYDSKGLLEAETDSLLRSKLSEIQYHYDGFDRLVKIDYPFSTDVEYTYGVPGQAGAGEIVHKKDESGDIHYEYGRLSEVVKETRTIKRYEPLCEPETATFTYRSDYLGRMQTMKYPDGETIIYTYDKGGQLKGVSGVKNTIKGSETYSYIDTIVYDEHGQRVYIKYGNGVETRYRYDDKRRWLKDIETKNTQTDEIFQKISYSFDKVGNVLGYANDASVYETSQSYTYDNLYQLIGVEGTSNQYKAIKSFGSTPVNVAKYKQDFAFDGIGNMTRKVSTTNLPGSRGNAYPKAELDYSLDYEYDPAYAHRLVHAGNRYYRYDANGNITAEKDGPFTEDDEFIFTYNYDPDTDVYGTDYGFGLDAPKEAEETHPENLFAYRRNYTWNEKNLLTKSSDRSYTVHYRYGEDGQRALKYTEEGRSETLYFNNFYTIHIPVQDKNNPQGLRVHKHIFVGNSRLVTAMTHTDNNGDNAEQREKRYYYHSDHLGSAQFVTDWRGWQYEHIEYTPYGELWIEEVAAGLDKLPFRFTGKEMDEETGLYYYGARYLDPKYSRWLSGDPALSDYIPKAPIDDEAKKHNENLPGMGGVFNVVNLHLYHYAGNNPVKYTDPDGRVPLVAILIVIGFVFALQSDVQPVTHIDAAVINNKLSSIYYDDPAKRTGGEIKSPYTRETSRAIKLEQHPVLALGAALPRGNYSESDYSDPNQMKGHAIEKTGTALGALSLIDTVAKNLSNGHLGDVTLNLKKTGRNITSWNITLTTINPLTGKTTGRQVLSRKDALKYLNENKEILKNDPAYKELWDLLN